MLEIAVANADVDVHGLAEAVIACRGVGAGLDSVALSKLTQAEQRLQQLLQVRLQEAVEALDPKNMWVTFLRMYRLYKQARTLGFSVPACSMAANKMQELLLSDDPDLNVLKLPRIDPSAIQHFQRLIDLCTLDTGNIWDLPKLTVERVIEVYHECTRAEYLLRRSQLVAECEKGGPVKQIPVKSQQLDWGPFLSGSHKPVEAKYNEFFAFHGTSPQIAEVITDTDFKIKRRADHGYTFGRGVYLSEYVTHAQFFSQCVCGGLDDNRCAILVCRVFCGRIQEAGEWKHTAIDHNRKAEFEHNLKDGTYHSTMGAEWPGNYKLREFVLADDDQVLPEFILICRSV